MNVFRSPWSSQTKTIVGLLLVALIIFLIGRFRAIIPPLIIAVIWSYILSPIAGFLQRRTRLPKAIAILLADLLILTVIITLPILFFPMIVNQFADLDLDLQEFLVKASSLFNYKITFGSEVIDFSLILNEARANLRTLLQPLISQTLNIVFEILASAVWIIFILIISFYLAKDADKLRDWMESLIPEDWLPDFISLRDEISEIWGAFFRSQILQVLVVMAIITTFGLIVGLPLALAMGLLAGLLEFLPSIGHGLWLFTATLLALLAGSTWLPIPHWTFALLIMLFHFVFQQFDLNYLTPRIIGRSVKLPPLVVILGALAGAAAAGVLGIPLAAPTIASARVLGRYIHANLFDIPTYSLSEVSILPPPDPYWWRRLRPRLPSEGDSETP